jgi:hypothetical protein
VSLHEHAPRARNRRVDLINIAAKGEHVTAFSAFMENLIDYAGLFPPASLDVPAAVAEYAHHKEESDVWMLGRFIAPVARLAEIGAQASPYASDSKVWDFSGLIGARDHAAQALAVLAEQGELVRTFESEHGQAMRVSSLEAAIPLDAAASYSSFIADFLKAAEKAGLGGREVFLEVLPGSDDKTVLDSIAAVAAGRADRLGAKLRCGGVTPEAFPTVERVATVIHHCATLDLPLKCTAGLHHPVRHQAVEPLAMMHGFLNVFGAGVLAWGNQADLATVTECVTETDPAAFHFDETGFSWRNQHVASSTLRQIRSQSLAGFGSCSFNEPREDLKNLGLL